MNISRTAGVALAGLCGSLLLAPPAAAADQDAYLRPLLTSYPFLSSHQLLAEASRACSIVETGRASSEAVPVVSKDLQVSVPVATDITIAAISYLGC